VACGEFGDPVEDGLAAGDLPRTPYNLGYIARWIGGGPEAIRAITASGQHTMRAAQQIPDSGSASVQGVA